MGPNETAAESGRNQDRDTAHLESNERTETFVRLLTEHERRFGRYAMTLIPRVEDSDEVLQEAKLSMWRAFDQFEIGTDFGAWGRKVIYRQALRFWRRSPRTRHRWLDEQTLEALASDVANLEPTLDAREHALGACMQKLQDEERQFLRLRYREEMSVERIAEQCDRTVGAVYRKLSRIRKALYDCVTHSLQVEAKT